MTNICELLINFVKGNKPKVLIGLDQKVYSRLILLLVWDYTDITAIGGEAGSTPSVLCMRNLVNPYLSRKGKQPARVADRGVGRGVWKKRMPVCSGPDKD